MPSRRQFVCGAAVLPGWAAADAAPQIAFDDSSPPTMYRDADGQPAGLYPRRVRAVLQRADLAATLSCMPFRRLLLGVERGELAGGALIRTPERLRTMRFSQAYIDESLLVLAGAQGPLPTRLEDLGGRVVGLIRGWSYGAALDGAVAAERFRVEVVAGDRQNLEKLRLGRVDAIVIAGPSWSEQQPYYPALRTAFRLGGNGIHLALPLAWPSATGWLARFDAALATLRRAGLGGD